VRFENAGDARGDRGRRGRRRAPLLGRVRLPVPAQGAPQALRLAQGLRHRWLGDKQIEFFYDDSLLPIRQPADIFTLKARDEANGLQRLKNREGYGETSAQKLFDAIDAARTIALDRLIFSLGIRHVGEQTAKTLARAYGDWAALHEAALAIADGDAGGGRGDGCAR
jgi:NAD-dependent DNA ligase